MIATIILLILHTIALTVHVIKHGEKTVKKFNGWHQFFAIIISMILYYYTGMFDKFFE